MVFEYNNEADENTELAKDASIYGVAYEEQYFPEESDFDGKIVKFKRLNPEETIPIYDKTIESNLIAVIRFYEDYDYTVDETATIVEVIDDTTVTRYKTDENFSNYELLESYSHYFGTVPVAVFENNED
jgi:SPP1 family phage portal protein